jgi:hypothetical protein
LAKPAGLFTKERQTFMGGFFSNPTGPGVTYTRPGDSGYPVSPDDAPVPGMNWGNAGEIWATNDNLYAAGYTVAWNGVWAWSDGSSFDTRSSVLTLPDGSQATVVSVNGQVALLSDGSQVNLVDGSKQNADGSIPRTAPSGNRSGPLPGHLITGGKAVRGTTEAAEGVQEVIGGVTRFGSALTSLLIGPDRTAQPTNQAGAPIPSNPTVLTGWGTAVMVAVMVLGGIFLLKGR